MRRAIKDHCLIFGEPTIILHHALSLFVAVIMLMVALFTSGCGDLMTAPAPDKFTLQSTLLLSDGGDVSQATVTIFFSPDDNSISQMLADYPSIGFSPFSLMLFDPLVQTPISISLPDSNGHFVFEDLLQGSYIIDADLSGYACPEPALVSLQSNTDIGILQLAA